MSDVNEREDLRALFDSDSHGLGDEELRDAALRFVEIAPDDLDAWWALANIDYWLLRDMEGHALRADARFEEMVSAYRHVIEIDPTDSAGPYNLATCLESARLLDEAFDMYVLAGDTESAHPRSEFEWPSWWHYEQAVQVALDRGDRERALSAASKAFETGDAPDPSPEDMVARLSAESRPI